MKMYGQSLKSCYFYTRALHHSRRHIFDDAAKTTACSMINERLENRTEKSAQCWSKNALPGHVRENRLFTTPTGFYIKKSKLHICLMYTDGTEMMCKRYIKINVTVKDAF